MNLTPRQIEKTINDLKTKHARQQAAADNTKDTIAAFQELLTSREAPTNATPKR